MRLDPLFDSFYALSSLLGMAAPQVCTPDPSMFEVTWSSTRNATATVTAFVNVNVVPMDHERVLPNQTVLVENGSITALGPASQVQVPAGAVRVDGQGKYLMPGLTDVHFGPFHNIEAPRQGQEQAFADDLFGRYLAHGVTGLRSLSGSDTSALQQLQRIFAEFPVPRMYLSPSLSRIEAVPWSDSGSTAVQLAAMKAAGYSHVVGRQIDSVALAALRRARLPIATHHHGMPFPKVLQLGVGGGSAEHLYIFWDSLLGKPGAGGVEPMTWKQQQLVELPMAKVPGLVATLKRTGVWVTPSLRCMEFVHRYIQGDALARLVKAMQDGGVKMLLGADGSALGGVHSELVAMVRAGLTPYQTLLTGTRNVAEYFHKLDSAGTVAVGKQADLVLLNGNPLDDVRHTWEPAGVMVAGRWLDRVTLDQRLLSSPRRWFEMLLRDHLPYSDPTVRELISYWTSSPPRSDEQWNALQKRIERVFVLADSLELSRNNRQGYGRVLPLVSTELGAIRTILTPEERVILDVNLHIWRREHARQGYTVTPPGGMRRN